MHFKVVGPIRDVETIASGGRIREIMRLRRQFGARRWRKMKGLATVRLQTGKLWTAELHWYQAHGVGKRKLKIKRLLDEQS